MLFKILVSGIIWSHILQIVLVLPSVDVAERNNDDICWSIFPAVETISKGCCTPHQFPP